MNLTQAYCNGKSTSISENGMVVVQAGDDIKCLDNVLKKSKFNPVNVGEGACVKAEGKHKGCPRTYCENGCLILIPTFIAI